MSWACVLYTVSTIFCPKLRNSKDFPNVKIPWLGDIKIIQVKLLTCFLICKTRMSYNLESIRIYLNLQNDIIKTVILKANKY